MYRIVAVCVVAGLLAAPGCAPSANEKRMQAENDRLLKQVSEQHARIAKLKGLVKACLKKRLAPEAATAPSIKAPPKKSSGRVTLKILKVRRPKLLVKKVTEIVVRASNDSPFFLDWVFAKAHAYGKDKEYLGKCLINYTNIRPGKSSTDSCYVTDVPARLVKHVHAEARPATKDSKRSSEIEVVEADWRR